MRLEANLLPRRRTTRVLDVLLTLWLALWIAIGVLAGNEPAGGPAAAAPCAETARLAQQQLDAITAGLRQLGRLDTTGLQQTIDRLQGVQPDLQRAATACQTEATGP